jgi:hypothetical protein
MAEYVRVYDGCHRSGVMLSGIFRVHLYSVTHKNKRGRVDLTSRELAGDVREQSRTHALDEFPEHSDDLSEGDLFS